jgi:hypothetical protein
MGVDRVDRVNSPEREREGEKKEIDRKKEREKKERKGNSLTPTHPPTLTGLALPQLVVKIEAAALELLAVLHELLDVLLEHRLEGLKHVLHNLRVLVWEGGFGVGLGPGYG